MKDKLLLVGSGGFGRVVSEFARRDYECAFLDDGHDKGEIICDIPVIGKTSELEELYPEYNKLVVSIGNNRIREEIYEKARKIGYSFPNILGDNVYISPYAKVGDGCIFGNNVSIQNGSVVGNGVILNPGVEIHHDSTVENYVLIYTNSVIRTYAKVFDRAKIGSNVTVSNEVTISLDEVVCDGCIVGI